MAEVGEAAHITKQLTLLAKAATFHTIFPTSLKEPDFHHKTASLLAVLKTEDSQQTLLLKPLFPLTGTLKPS